MKKKPIAKLTSRRLRITTGLLMFFIAGLLLNTALPAQTTGAIDREQESEEPVTPTVAPKRQKVVKTSINLEIAVPPGMEKAETKEPLAKMLNHFLKIASVVDKRNKQALHNPFTDTARQRIARFLSNASKIETDDCYKHYLEKLSKNVLEDGNFQVTLPHWTSLEENRLEIVFPEDYRYERRLLAYEYFLNLPPLKNARKKGRGLEAVIYLNDLEATQKFREYTDLLGKMQFNLPAAPGFRSQDITFSAIPPAFKIVHLVYAPRPDGFTRIYPEMNFKNAGKGPDNIQGENGFKIIIFKNLVNAYLEGVIKPIAAQVLAEERMWDVDYESYFSNQVMKRISHHLGPVFVLKLKDEEEQIPPWLKHTKRKPKTLKKKKKKEKELKLIRDVLGDLFPVIETIKAQAIALHNTDVLIRYGLLPADKDISVYSAYLVSLIDDLRKMPPATAAGQTGRKQLGGKRNFPGIMRAKAALVQFNFFLEEEAFVFNISDQTFEIDRFKFKEAAKKLTKNVLMQLRNATYFTVNGFITRGLEIPPQLDEVLTKLQDIPLDIEFQLPEIIITE